MNDIHKLLEKFKEHQEDLHELGSMLVKKYPQSNNLLKFVEELDSAVSGLDSLHSRLEEVLNEAEADNNLSEDLAMQMSKSKLYSEMSEGDKKKLVTYLVDNHAGIVEEEELLQGLESELSNRSAEELLAEFPKKHIVQLGKEVAEPDSDDFAIYKAGMNFLKEKLADATQKAELVKDLARAKFEDSPSDAVKQFYSKAFEPNKVQPPKSIESEPPQAEAAPPKAAEPKQDKEGESK